MCLKMAFFNSLIVSLASHPVTPYPIQMAVWYFLVECRGQKMQVDLDFDDTWVKQWNFFFQYNFVDYNPHEHVPNGKFDWHTVQLNQIYTLKIISNMNAEIKLSTVTISWSFDRNFLRFFWHLLRPNWSFSRGTASL